MLGFNGGYIMNTIKIDKKGVKMIAHRGLSGIERENTYPAFVAAANRSYFGIECDIHKTADGEFVVIHDKTTERISGGKYNIDVEKSSFETFKDIVLPDLDGKTERKDIKIPLLIDYIKICKKYEKVCVIEIKNSFSKSDLAKVVEIIKKEEYLNQVIFISFDFNNCLYLREIGEDINIQWLVGKDVTDKHIETMKLKNINADIYYPALTKEIVDYLHGLGLKINSWTCDNKADAERLIEMGVDYITTNILE